MTGIGKNKDVGPSPMTDYAWGHGSGITGRRLLRSLDQLNAAVQFTPDFCRLPFPDAGCVTEEGKSAVGGVLLNAMAGINDWDGINRCNEHGQGAVLGMAKIMAMEPDRQLFTADFAELCVAETAGRTGDPKSLEGTDRAALDACLAGIYESADGALGGKEEKAALATVLWKDLERAMPACPNGSGEPLRAAAQYVIMDKACSLMGCDLDMSSVDAARTESMLSGREPMDWDEVQGMVERSLADAPSRQDLSFPKDGVLYDKGEDGLYAPIPVGKAQADAWKDGAPPKLSLGDDGLFYEAHEEPVEGLPEAAVVQKAAGEPAPMSATDRIMAMAEAERQQGGGQPEGPER